MSELLPIPVLDGVSDGPLVSTDLIDEARRYVGSARSANTTRAYRADWRHFIEWCSVHGFVPLPAEAETVVLYVTDLARTASTSTIRRRLSSVSVAHQAAGFATPTIDPVVRAAWAGIRRVNGTVQAQKTALLTDDIRRMVGCLAETMSGHRDRCLLLLGFAGAFRRSELVALDITDVEDTADGLVVTIRRSKTDQDGEGRQIGIPYGSDPTTCPVRAYRRWLASSASDLGPLFRGVDRHGNVDDHRLSDRAVALVVKRTALAAGLNADRVAGHSLRSGMATSAARSGASEASIMATTGHRSLPVLRRYIRRGISV